MLFLLTMPPPLLVMRNLGCLARHFVMRLRDLPYDLAWQRTLRLQLLRHPQRKSGTSKSVERSGLYDDVGGFFRGYRVVEPRILGFHKTTQASILADSIYRRPFACPRTMQSPVVLFPSPVSVPLVTPSE